MKLLILSNFHQSYQKLFEELNFFIFLMFLCSQSKKRISLNSQVGAEVPKAAFNFILPIPVMTFNPLWQQM